MTCSTKSDFKIEDSDPTLIKASRSSWSAFMLSAFGINPLAFETHCDIKCVLSLTLNMEDTKPGKQRLLLKATGQLLSRSRASSFTPKPVRIITNVDPYKWLLFLHLIISYLAFVGFTYTEPNSGILTCVMEPVNSRMSSKSAVGLFIGKVF